MYRNTTLIVLMLLLYCSATDAQYYNKSEAFLKANSVWAFGEGGGLDFNLPGGPVPIQTGLVNNREGSASVADSTGKLLFYLGNNGVIYNRNHTIMFNGAGIFPATTSIVAGTTTQGALIVPVIDTPWKYYVFVSRAYDQYAIVNNGMGTLPAQFLTYSVVDMTLDSGRGGVVPGRKNILVESVQPLSEAMIAIPGENCDIWLLAYYPALYPNIVPVDTISYFKAWHITRSGIDPTPVISPTSQLFSVCYGYMAVSPDRQKVGLASSKDQVLNNSEGILLGQFNPGTGKVTNDILLESMAAPYAVCFSPDNTKLYTTGLMGVVHQYDISVYNPATIMASQYMVANTPYYGIKLYNDTVYLRRDNSIDRINNPNSAGSACNYNFNDIILPSSMMAWGLLMPLPNEVVLPNGVKEEYTSQSLDIICYTESGGYVEKSLSAPNGFLSYKWDNGTTGNSRQITAPGTYWVKYYSNHSPCWYAYTDSFVIEELDLTFSLGEDRNSIFCNHPESFLQLEVNIPHANYLWQDGSTANRYKVTAPGNYWVEVSKNGCVAADTVNINDARNLDLGPDIILCKGDPIDVTLYAPDIPETFIKWSTGSDEQSIHITDPGLYWVNLIYPPCTLTDSISINVEICECFTSIPNAFSPNGDGVNDYFFPVIETDCPINTFTFSIYNRFGQRIFSSFNATQGWDGSHNGAIADAGTYFYELRFEGGTRRKSYYRKGDVTLIR